MYSLLNFSHIRPFKKVVPDVFRHFDVFGHNPYQECNARKVTLEVYTSFVLQGTFFGR